MGGGMAPPAGIKGTTLRLTSCHGKDFMSDLLKARPPAPMMSGNIMPPISVVDVVDDFPDTVTGTNWDKKSDK